MTELTEAQSAANISSPQVSFDDATELWEVSCQMLGEEVFLRSKTELAARSEGPVAALMLQSLSRTRPVLVPQDPLDSEFVANLSGVAEIAKDWWGFDGPLPQAQIAAPSEGGDATGMFFTCGVDSFYTLRRNVDQVTYLINVHGFDIALGDTDRQAKAEIGLQAAADELGLELVMVETNLRANKGFRGQGWEITHVGALAMVAHSLVGKMHSIHVASSDVPPPWGSHPDLDRLWSSSALRVINDEYNLSRFDKVREIVNWGPAQRHLKVCWENLSSDLNCGVCEKCVRTQAAINATGDLSLFETFPKGDLARRIAHILTVSPFLTGQWKVILSHTEDWRVARAIRRLLWRGQIAQRHGALLRRWGVNKWLLRRLTLRRWY